MALCEICGTNHYGGQCPASTPYCDQCNESDKCNAEMDSLCVIYHPKYPGQEQSPSKLQNLGMPNGSSAEKIFEAIDKFLGNNANTPIIPLDTLSIDLTTSGLADHTLRAELRVSTDPNNQIEVRNNGVYAKPYNEHYLVKVSKDDTPDYLKNQIIGGTDKIVSITVTEQSGILSIQPSLNIQCLLDALSNNEQFVNLICTIVRACQDKCADILEVNSTITTS